MASVKLTIEEQRMFDGEAGEAARESMEILVALGRIYGAQRMVPVTSVQVSGVSYKTIGEAGLGYLKGLAQKGAKARVPAFLNPAGMDIAQWKEMRVPEDFARKQIEVLDAYASMGISKTCTCAPYFIGIRPKRGEHIAWAESSAVAFANSVLGARTNREGGPSALAAAICGVTPYYGLHIEKNRVASLVVDVKCGLRTIADFGALGSLVGKLAKNRNPAFHGIKKAGEPGLKVLGASMAATGSVPVFFVEGITPEYAIADKPEIIAITDKDLEAERKAIDSGLKPSLVTIGCPHASLEEIKEVAGLVAKRKPTCEFWVCTSRKLKEDADRLGYSGAISAAGGRVVADTCMVVCPLEEMGYVVTGTNSGKAAAYLPNLCKQKVAFGDLEDILYR
ncbi:aconitase X catalytic domain-containing protein [Candidatus Micrarchaeota archaeon]|nr:aconitase X catalytic domain-containing protein [Candidatus Micrarchaeota archaeon]